MLAGCVAVVLAAGAGKRMGGPKALLEYNGMPLLQLHVERALALGCAHVSAIVTPEVFARLAPALSRRFGSELSLVAARTDSQASSLALLLRTLAKGGCLASEATFLITPVDVLPCSATTYRTLHAALEPQALAATPRFGARGGHPVLVRSALLEVYVAASAAASPSLRDVLERTGDRRKRVVVDDSAVLSDMDTRADAGALGLSMPR